jgi:hypothetical protein
MIYWTVIIEYLYKNGFTIPVHQTSSKESREWKRSVIFEKFYTYLIVFFNITLYSLDNSKWTILYTKKNKYDEHIKFCPLFLVKYIPRIRILHLHPPKIQTLAPPLLSRFALLNSLHRYSLFFLNKNPAHIRRIATAVLLFSSISIIARPKGKKKQRRWNRIEARKLQVILIKYIENEFGVIGQRVVIGFIRIFQ